MSATQTTRPTIVEATPIPGPSAGSQTPAPAKPVAEPVLQPLGRDQTSPQATDPSMPIVVAPAGAKTGRDHRAPEAHLSSVSATNVPGDHSSLGAQTTALAGDLDQPTAMVGAIPNVASPLAASSPPAAIAGPTSKATPPQVGDPFLALAADVVDDLEKVRIANENRFRQLTRDEADADGEERGFGLTEDHPDVARLAALVDMLAGAEHKAVLNLQRLMRQNPLGPWVKATKGIGEKQAARLLATIGDPYIRPEIVRKDGTVEPSRPRTVSELWAYCGLHVLPAGQGSHDNHSTAASGNQTGSHPDHLLRGTQTDRVGVAPKRQKGQRANWSTLAKTRAYLVAESCIKQRTSPFRAVYDDTRAKYADAIHQVPCARCGPSGKPAPAGSPLSDGHKHARAMRAVSKAVLKELWRESKRLHEAGA